LYYSWVSCIDKLITVIWTASRKTFSIFGTAGPRQKPQSPPMTLKGLGHEMNIYRYVLDMHCTLGFTIFCCLVDEKIRLKVLACPHLKFLLILKILSATIFRDPKAAIFAPGNAYRKPPVIM
jgi:hypothetical protein